MSYWLIKADPKEYSWENMLRDNITIWDGVKNYQAISNIKKMVLNDKIFFYHSYEKYIVGIVKVIKEYYIHNNEIVVDIEVLSTLKNKISLQDIKQHKELSNMRFLKQSRLSVSEVYDYEWNYIISISK